MFYFYLRHKVFLKEAGFTAGMWRVIKSLELLHALASYFG